MKKLLLFIVFSFLYLPTALFAVTADEIKAFYDYDHGALLDRYWLRPTEIYNQWMNHSRVTTSRLAVTYHRKNRRDTEFLITESLKDYLDDPPLRWKHILRFSKRFVQGYKKTHQNIFEQYEIREEEGNLKIYNKEYNFAIGEFEKDGKYSSGGFYKNIGGLNLDFWLKVFYDPWDQKMWVHELLTLDEDKYTDFKYTVNADDFFFRFKNETRLRRGKLIIKELPGFRHAIALFSYEGKNAPISIESDIRMDYWTEQTIHFDITYKYDVERLSIDPDGMVKLNQTYEEFLAG